MDWQIGLGKGTRGEWSGLLNGWKCILIYPNISIYGKHRPCCFQNKEPYYEVLLQNVASVGVSVWKRLTSLCDKDWWQQMFISVNHADEKESRILILE